MTTQKLIVSTDEQEIELFINAAGMLYIGDITQPDDPARNFYFTISKEDWDSIKAFVDKQVFQEQPY